MAGVLNFSEAAALALHSVELLAHAGGKSVTSGELSRLLNCSASHLAKVLQRLVRCEIVESTRGPGGGFRLGAEAIKRLSLLDVYEAIDGPLQVQSCLLGNPACLLGGCWFSGFSAAISERVKSDLSHRALSQLVGNARENERATPVPVHQ